MLLHCGIGSDVSESALLAPGWLRPETLDSLLELNELAFALLVEQAAERSTHASGLVSAVSAVWRRLDGAARRRAASCPYLLLDAGFADVQRWSGTAGAQVSDVREGPPPFFTVRGALEAARLVFTYAWHLARTQPAAARLLLGMRAPCAAAIAQYSLRQAFTLAESHAAWLRPRWSARPEVWQELLAAAASGEELALERARLHGLTLLAAESRVAAPERAQRFTGHG
ncbi:MAG: hypothetical protein ACHQD6_00370 [Steroidobacterales bacterium]|jgi:hypothetical protein